MNIFKKFSFLVILLTPFFLFVNSAEAAENQFITIVNPVRVSSYNPNPAVSLESEYGVIFRNNLPATWLLTFDIISNGSTTQVLKKFNNKQELGIFLEVTPKFAEAAGVKYYNAGFWHFANAVFLSGYTQEERIKLIDAVFAEFKKVFGYYPTSVGSWWTDSYSLSYMKDRYGVTANLGCSDQFSTDGYQIWGQPWGVPYYPSKLHAGVPASNESVKLDIVNIQWAPRDPLNGYESSLYSTQDYLMSPKPQSIDYFEKLVNFYTRNQPFGQITIGQEADLDPDGYKREFSKQMDVVRQHMEKGVNVVTMSSFANWYRNKYPGLSPNYSLEADDLLGTNSRSFWYISSNYRLFYIKNSQEIKIKDLRIYNKDITEPYYESPNYEFSLSINIPSVIDGANNPDDVWILPSGTEIETQKDRILIKGKNIKIPERIKRLGDLINIKTKGDLLEISFPGRIQSQEYGNVIKGFSSEAIHFLKQKKAVFYLLTGKGWDYFRKVSYFVPQGEIYALLYLKSLPKGKVMVYNNECLQCSWHTKFKPPAFANIRSYVQKYSQRPVVYNKTVFEAKERGEAKKEFKKTGVKYVYLVKFENYSERLPFSPGDLGVEKIFSNANAEIWVAKK